ncbi:MAG TPA: hypothetical protein VMB50_15385, partial [Myxococcales bacterium]|nr:hypothetical protein [Myxococcales bacterium]
SKGPGTPCQTDADCGGPYLTTCCQDAVLGSICLAGNACDLYWDAGCQTSAQCFSATDNTCCTSLQETLGFGLCLPTGACSSCGPSSPCPSGQSCCTPAGSGQSFCVAGTSCGNQCTSNADCGSDLCCPEPDSSTKFCTPASGGVCATGACQTSADCPSSPSEPLGCCLPSATTLYGTCVPLQNGTLPASCAQ